MPTTNIDSSTWNPTCAGHHFGVWMIEPEWFRSAISAVRDGIWKARADIQGLPSNADTRRRSYVVAKGTAVIPIAGVMMKARSKFGGTSTVDVRTQIREAVNDDSVSSILILIDSPGGTVAGTEALAQEVANADGKKPTYAHIEDCGASAAYYVASQARRITASPSSLVGSLGIMMALDDTAKKNEMAGVKTFLVSSGGMKGAGVEGTEVTAEQLEYFQGIVDSATQHFKNAVMRGRGMSAQTADELFNGKVFDAAQAKSLDLIDDVVSLDAAFASAQEDVADDEDDRLDRNPKSTSTIEVEAIANVLASQGDSHKKIAALVNTLASSTPFNKAPEVSTTLVEPSPALPTETSHMANESTQTTPAQAPAPATNGLPQGNPPTPTEQLAQLRVQADESHYQRGLREGREEGKNSAHNSLKSIVAACPNKPQMAINAFLNHQTPDAVKIAYDAVVEGEVALEKQKESMQMEIERLKALNEIGGNSGVGMTVAGGDEYSTYADPKAQAEMEWDQKPAVRKGFGSKASYVAFRKNELEGRMHFVK